MSNPNLTLTFIDDPKLTASTTLQIERGQRNLTWLGEHWGDLLPQARGKFVAVAGQEAHIAESPEDAWAWAKTKHPEDTGALVQFVRLKQGPRIYANSGNLASM